MYAAVVGGTAITYVTLALVHAKGATWLIPIPVAAAAAALIALTSRRHPR